MSMKQRDEEKRTKLWRIVVIVSTIIIILVAIVLIVDSVVRNPLEGKWVSDDGKYHLDIEDEQELTLGLDISGVYTEVDLRYTIDKDTKIVTIKKTLESYEDAADDAGGAVTAREIDEVLEKIVDSYDYSVENNTLILAEREYGDQFKFTRVK